MAARIAIIKEDKFKIKKCCHQECKKSCPVVKTGKRCIEVNPASKFALISEELCIGRGRVVFTKIVQKCPFDAIKIINLPKDLDRHSNHIYGPNTFRLHRLPVRRPDQVWALLEQMELENRQHLNMLSGKLKHNFGRFNNPPDWAGSPYILPGSELQKYFTRLLEDKLKEIVRRQDLETILEKVEGM